MPGRREAGTAVLSVVLLLMLLAPWSAVAGGEPPAAPAAAAVSIEGLFAGAKGNISISRENATGNLTGAWALFNATFRPAAAQWVPEVNRVVDGAFQKAAGFILGNDTINFSAAGQIVKKTLLLVAFEAMWGNLNSTADIPAASQWYQVLSDKFKWGANPGRAAWAMANITAAPSDATLLSVRKWDVREGALVAFKAKVLEEVTETMANLAIGNPKFYDTGSEGIAYYSALKGDVAEKLSPAAAETVASRLAALDAAARSGDSPGAASQADNITSLIANYSSVVVVDVHAFQWGFDPSAINATENSTLYIRVTASLDKDPSLNEHGFEVSGYELQIRLKAGETGVLKFAANRSGEFLYFCTVLCGTDHARMQGRLVVTGGSVDLSKRTGTIIDFLKLAAEEYAGGVKEGKVVEEGEYEEAKIFHAEARRQFTSIYPELKAKDAAAADRADGLMAKLGERIERLAPPSEVKALVEEITYELAVYGGAPSVRKGPAAVIQEVKKRLDDAATLYRQGRRTEAEAKVTESYLEFEKVEKSLRSRDPSLTSRLEEGFNLKVKGKIRAGAPVAEVEKEVAAVKADLKTAEGILTAAPSGPAAFANSFIIIVREGFEAILIVGALISYLIVSKNGDKVRQIYLGAGAGVLLSFVTALVIQFAFASATAGQEILEGVASLIAVAVLFYVSFWLIGKVQAERWQRFIQGKLKDAITKGRTLTLASVSFIAVYREGFETVLFYQPLVLQPGTQGMVLTGFLLGCAVLAVIFVLFYRYGVKIPVKPFFIVTSGLLYYLAISFTGYGVRELQEAGVVGTTPIAGAGAVELVNFYPTVETVAAQALLIVLLLLSLVYVFLIQPKTEKAGTGGRAGGD